MSLTGAGVFGAPIQEIQRKGAKMRRRKGEGVECRSPSASLRLCIFAFILALQLADLVLTLAGVMELRSCLSAITLSMIRSATASLLINGTDSW